MQDWGRLGRLVVLLRHLTPGPLSKKEGEPDDLFKNFCLINSITTLPWLPLFFGEGAGG